MTKSFTPDFRATVQALRSELDALAPDCESRGLALEVDLLRTHGLLSSPLPRAAGGRGLGTEVEATKDALRALRVLGRSNLSMGRLFEGHMNAIKLVGLYGRDEQKEAVFESVRRGALLGVWGADGPVPVTIDRNGEEVILHGGKRFASGLGLVHTAIVTARLEDGIQLLLVDVDEEARMDHGGWRVSGMKATASGRYDFEGTVAGSEAILGEVGDFLREPHFEGGVWRYAALHLGAMEAMAEAVRQSLLARETHDPSQMHRLASLAASCLACRTMLEEVAARVEAPGAGAAEVAQVLLAREMVENACQDAIAVVDRALGTASYFEGHPVERIRRDLGFFLRQANLDGKLRLAASAILESPNEIGDQ